MTDYRPSSIADHLAESAPPAQTSEVWGGDDALDALALLLNHFDHLITRPADIPALNQTILQLAVRGKLVPQDPADEPAAVLVERIKVEKVRLVKEGKIRNDKPLPPIKKNEIPYDVPTGWLWVRLPEIYHDLGQTKPDQPFTYIDVSSINNAVGVIGDDLQVIRPEDAPSRARKLVAQGTVIYSTVRPYLLNVAIVDREFDPLPIVSTAFAVMHPFSGVDNKFLFYYLRSQPFIDFVEAQMTGMAYPAINDSKLQQGLFPLPPLAEQKRIVAQVERLLAQTRALAADLAQAGQERISLNRAALGRLLAPRQTSEVSKTSEVWNGGGDDDPWSLIAAHFDLLYDDPANVAELKQAILQLAVQGRLVPQDPVDEPAAGLVERIEAEKRQLVKEGKIGKVASATSVNEAETPFEIPPGWKWVKFGEIIESLRYGTSKRCDYDAVGNPVLRIPNLVDGEISIDDLKYTELTLDEIDNLRLEPGDLLLVRSNGSETLVGRSAIVRENMEGFAFAGYLVRARTFPEFVFSEYLHLSLESSYTRIQIEGPIRTTSGVKNINSTEISNLILPLPPLAEQKRIVAQVERLLARCEAVQAGLAEAEAARGRLVAAVLAKVARG